MPHFSSEIPAKPDEFIAYWAKMQPEAPALSFADKALTYRQLHEELSRFVTVLRNGGVQPGERCAVVMPNSHQNIPLIAAIQHVGACPVVINSAATPNELAAILEHVQASFLFKSQPNPSLQRLSSDAREVSSPEHALILHTSGSSGAGKAVVITYEAIAHGLRWRRELIEATAGPRRLVALSLSYAAGLGHALPVLYCGKTLFLSSLPAHPDVVLSAIERNSITSISGPPFLFSAMLERGAGTRYSINSLQQALAAGALLPDSTRQTWNAKVPHGTLFPVYSMSELHLLPFVPDKRESALKSGCVGKPPSDVETKISVDGELLIRPPYRVAGYFNDRTLNEFRIDRDGWFHTLDAVQEDADGDYIYLGSCADLINSGGNKISPAEIENCLLSLNGVAAAKVFAVAHPALGNSVVAAVHRADETITEERIRAHCFQKLSPFKVPADIIFVGPEELTGNVKISKPKAMERLEEKWRRTNKPSGKN